jgi:hypothetical protein
MGFTALRLVLAGQGAPGQRQQRLTVRQVFLARLTRRAAETVVREMPWRVYLGALAVVAVLTRALVVLEQSPKVLPAVTVVRVPRVVVVVVLGK